MKRRECFQYKVYLYYTDRKVKSNMKQNENLRIIIENTALRKKNICKTFNYFSLVCEMRN